MFRLHEAAIVRPHVSESVKKKNYVAIAICMTDISPLHKLNVNVTSGKHFYYI